MALIAKFTFMHQRQKLNERFKRPFAIKDLIKWRTEMVTTQHISSLMYGPDKCQSTGTFEKLGFINITEMALLNLMLFLDIREERRA
jgi:hypothetical protein